MTVITNSYLFLSMKQFMYRTAVSLSAQIDQWEPARQFVDSAKTYIDTQVDFIQDLLHDPCDRTKAKIEALSNTAFGFVLSLFTSLWYVGSKMDAGEIDLGKFSDAVDVSFIFVVINVGRGYVCRRFFAWRYGCSQSKQKSLMESSLNAVLTFIISLISYSLVINPLLSFFDLSMSNFIVSVIATIYFTFFSIYRGYWVRIFCMKYDKPKEEKDKFMDGKIDFKSSGMVLSEHMSKCHNYRWV